MAVAKYPFQAVRASLADVVGESYLEAVIAARAALAGDSSRELGRLAHRPVVWYPAPFHRRLLALLPKVGLPVCAAASNTAGGATTQAFAAASHREAAPLTGYGFYRVGEDGRLYLLTKSEHYHTPLGHAFPGYQLLETARRLSIPNATHNNTRGHLTRLLEEELVRTAHGLTPDNQGGLDVVLADTGMNCLNRVLNLETGSLAVEAGVKMMLARFYQVQSEAPAPLYHGRIPVFLVIGDEASGRRGNYHGTTVLTQMLRGMWPGLAARLDDENLFRICPIRPNSTADLAAAFERYERPPCKIAGFIHEIVLMNYGAKLLSRDFLEQAYAQCAQHDVPTLADEIQSGLWAPGLFLFRAYGLRPSFVALGKGFPGGEYPASRLLCNTALDILPQFGALVTNGQEELASLAYLVTMRWAQANAAIIQQIGDYYEERLRSMAAQYPAIIVGISGQRHLAGLEFHDLETARFFTASLNQAGFDISAQTYKAECPPVALTKLPLTACQTVVDFIITRMTETLATANHSR